MPVAMRIARLDRLDPGSRNNLDPPLRFYAADGCIGHDLNAARRLNQALGVTRSGADAPEVEKPKAWMPAMAREAGRNRGSIQDGDVPNSVIAQFARRPQSRRPRADNDSGSHQPLFRLLVIGSGSSRMRHAASCEMRRVQ